MGIFSAIFGVNTANACEQENVKKAFHHILIKKGHDTINWEKYWEYVLKLEKEKPSWYHLTICKEEIEEARRMVGCNG